MYHGTWSISESVSQQRKHGCSDVILPQVRGTPHLKRPKISILFQYIDYLISLMQVAIGLQLHVPCAKWRCLVSVVMHVSQMHASIKFIANNLPVIAIQNYSLFLYFDPIVEVMMSREK